jgi:hypothetical protein
MLRFSRAVAAADRAEKLHLALLDLVVAGALVETIQSAFCRLLF